MLRQASSRNQRTKGFRVKHALQICLLVAVCIWLLYQIKHSHEKKRAFDERNSKILSKVVEDQPDFFKFGRKDLPRSEEAGSMHVAHNMEEENEEAQEEEQETKQEEIEDEEGRGAGDDEIDEQDQEKADEEAERGEESTEEYDKDSHDEDKDGHDEVDLFDDPQDEGGTQEAREENYKRDDASSAVVHNTHTTESETGSGEARSMDEEQIVDKGDDDSSANGSEGDDDSGADGSKGDVVAENLEKVVEAENVTSGTDDGSRGDNDLSAGTVGRSTSDVSGTHLKDNESMPTDNLSANVTTADNKDVEVEFSKPDNGAVSNLTTVESGNQMEQQKTSTMEAESNNHVELQTNSTVDVSDHQKEMQNNTTVVDTVGVPMSNNTVLLDSTLDQNTTVDNATGREDARNSENVMKEQAEKSNTMAGLEEQSTTSSSTNENGDAAQGESDNSLHVVVAEEERDARTDLSTLPDIQNEAKTTDDEAAE